MELSSLRSRTYFFPLLLTLVASLASVSRADTRQEWLDRCVKADISLVRALNVARAHDTIQSDLFNGELRDVRKFSENDNKQDLFRVSVKARDPFTGAVRWRQAFFKPRQYGDGGGWARAPMEYVAYYVNRKLGMDYVPPVAYRKNLSIEYGGKTFTEGAVVLEAPEFMPVVRMRGGSFGDTDPGVRSDSRILNVLLQNQDGHGKNVGIGKHWVDGWHRPVFIDFGASLRSGANVSIDRYHAYGNDARVESIRQSTLDNLRKLNYEDLKPLVNGGMISSDEAWFMLSIANGIVSHFDGLAAKAVREGRSRDTVVLPF